MLIGRREDFAWTLTSAGADIIDIFVETLCEGSDTKYLYKGKCRDMTLFNAGTLDGQPVRFDRTIHGPVVRLRDRQRHAVAVSRKRSSYLLDGVDLLLFQRLTRSKVRSAPETSPATPARFDLTFNTVLRRSRDIAIFSTGRLPIRAPGSQSGPADARHRRL